MVYLVNQKKRILIKDKRKKLEYDALLQNQSNTKDNNIFNTKSLA